MAQELFADSMTVRQLKEAARLRSPAVLARYAALEAARARLHATGFSPAASIGAELEEVPGGLDVGGAGSIRVDVSRELLSRGVRAARRAVASRDIDRAQAELELVERSVGARVDQALTLTVGAIAIGRRLAAEDSLLASAEEGVRARFAVGDARYVDVLRLRTERLRVQTDAATVVTEARIGRQLLSTLVATEAEADAERTMTALDSVLTRELRDPLRAPLPAAPGLDSLVVLSGAARLGEIAVARAEASRRLLGAQQRPAIVASIGLQRFVGDDGAFTIGPTAGASLSLPFTAQRGNRAAMSAAERDVAAAETGRRAAIAVVRVNLTAAWQRYEASRQRLALFDAALLRGARDERESALAAYRSGDLSLLELLDFERALARAEIARLRSRMAAADALADLLSEAAGMPMSSGAAFILPSEEDR